MKSGGAREPWSDERLDAAFAARADAHRTPADLAQSTIGRVRAVARPEPGWWRLLPAAAVVVLALSVGAGALLLAHDDRGTGPFRAGPSADLRTFDNGEFAFDFPAAWLGYEAAQAGGSGGTPVAVLGTQPVEGRCGTEQRVDLTCVYEQRLEPGRLRVFVLLSSYRGQTVQDRAAIQDGTTTRGFIGGMPALFDEFEPRPESYYREDQLVHWEIARPGTGGASVVRFEAMLKEPGVSEGRGQLQALVDSFRFVSGPDPTATPTPASSEAAVAPRLADLRLISVEELVAATVAPTADEVIVRGWLARSNATFDCDVERDPHPLIPHCEEFGLFLMHESERVDRGSLEPSVTHVVPMLRVDTHSEVTLIPGIPVEVLAVGHILDHRFNRCPEAQQFVCRKRFVIDRMVPANEPIVEDLPTPWASPRDLPVTGATTAVDILSSVVGSVRVVSIGMADPDALRSIEWHTRGTPDLQTSWVIRALVGGDDRPIARTFLVGDEGHATVFEVNGTGIVNLIDPPPSPPPTHVLGLPVMSLKEAVAIRDGGRDVREIAVRGWYPPQRAIRCRGSSVPITFRLEEACTEIDSLLASDSNGSGPSIKIDLDDLDQSWDAERRADAVRITPLEPIEIVAVGHFDDRHAGWCHATRIDECRDRFVVDHVDWVAGVTQPTSVFLRSSSIHPPFAPVRDLLKTELPDRAVLSAAVWPGASLGDAEPALREGREGITDQEAVWIVRVVQDGRAVTYLVPDQTDRVYRVETDGQTVLVAGTPPEDPPRPWPPVGVLDVPMPAGGTGVTPKAGVVDRTGLLVEARAAADQDPRADTTELSTGEMSIVQAAPDTIIAYWGGTLCDDRFVLTVYGERAGVPPDRLELRRERADSCRLSLVHRGIVLRFSQPLDAATIRGWDRVGTPFEAFPPIGATVVALPNYGGGFTTPGVRTALVDLSGRIKAVRLPRADEARPVNVVGQGALVPDASVAGRYQLIWNGGVCTPEIVITIDAALSKVIVSNPVPGNCDTIGNEYRIVLDIEGRLDPPAVEVRYTETSAGAS